jgi:hypothetical protein
MAPRLRGAGGADTGDDLSAPDCEARDCDIVKCPDEETGITEITCTAASASATGPNSRKETNGCYKNHHRALIIAGNAFAGSYRVHYNVRGSGRDITVQAESSAEARRTVMDMIPNAVVTGVHRVTR